MDIRERAEFMKAKEILDPHQVGVVEAAEHYAKYLDRQKAIQGSISMSDALDQWSGSYVRRETSKARQDRYVTIEDNLLEWLLQCPKKRGSITGRNFLRNFDSVREKAGFVTRTRKGNGTDKKSLPKWTADIMRHSYASYWLADRHDRARLAEQMGNSLAVIRQHYRRAIPATEGKQFWEIRPSGETRKVVQFKERTSE
jgi:integrase